MCSESDWGLSVVIEEEEEERHLGERREIWLSNIAYVFSGMKLKKEAEPIIQ